MTFAAPRRFGIAAFALSLLTASALAQTEPAAGPGRTWTDPPAREAAAPTTEVPKSAKAAPAPRAAAKPVRAAKVARVHPAPRTKVAVRPIAPRRVAVDAAPRIRAPVHAPAFRVVTVRPTPYAAPPVIRYGYVVEAAPARPLPYEDMRAARIRRAEEAGYLVIRSRSVEFPDGRRLRTYRPLDADADD